MLFNFVCRNTNNQVVVRFLQTAEKEEVEVEEEVEEEEEEEEVMEPLTLVKSAEH